ncbi:MAG: bifunctional folylpolyglutamate synthase/dihydrofolate synthase, partial [Leuconostoc mesenteroides]
MKTVEDAISYIHNRPKGGQKESLYRMTTLLAALGNLQNDLPYAIHITGTNGKGSVSTMASNILRVAGYDTGLFVSPFITNFRERIQINNEMISKDDLLHATNKVAQVLVNVDAELYPDIPVEFEVLTAIMFTYFSSKKLDALVIEVGIGGLLDSTNVMPNTKVAVITSVGLDHQKMLGNTITEIASQKAGIIHDDVAVVTGDLPDEARLVIEKKTPPRRHLGRCGFCDHRCAGI